MAKSIGELIEEIAKSKNIKQEELGKKINKTKQNVGHIYTRETIDTDLLLTLTKELNFDFFQFFYDNNEILKKFRQHDIDNWNEKIAFLNNLVDTQEKTIKLQAELLETQRKYIAEMERNNGA